MDKSELELNRFFDLEEWEKLIKRLADAFGIAVAMLDYKGNNAFEPVNDCKFCSAILSNPEGKKRCLKCITLGSLEAARQEKALITHCHTGLSIGVVPIMVGESFIGTLCFGQVLLEGESEQDRNDCILGTRSSIDPGTAEELKEYLTELFGKVRVMGKEQFRLIADAMEQLMRSTVKRTIDLKSEKQSYELLLKNAISPLIGVQNTPASAQSAENVSASDSIQPYNQLYPAVRYIEEHPEEAVTMHDMAELCHLSHSYFSKLWFRDMGENFTNYVNRIKTELAKQRLQNSSDSISFIASSLGFSDTSYFIKVFKKVVGITPLAYRQHKYLQK